MQNFEMYTFYVTTGSNHVSRGPFLNKKKKDATIMNH